jgi:HSP20 family molecular chaperone IbpA
VNREKSKGESSVWLICQTTLGKGKNKLLVRGIDGAEWVFCPMVKSIKKGKVSTDNCQGCKYFVSFEQIYIPQTYTTRKTVFFRTFTLKGASNITRTSSKLKITHSRTPLFPYIPTLIDERQPLVDVFEEEDHLIVLVELPGVDKEDVHIKVEENTLTISAINKTRNYIKKVWLPASIKKDTIKFTYRNGILQIKLEKLHSKAG